MNCRFLFAVIFVLVILEIKAQTANAKAPAQKKEPEKSSLRIRNYNIQKNAHFEEGDEALFTLIASVLKYSEADKAKSVNGSVLLRFDVDADSSVKEVRIIRDPCVDCGKDLVKIFEALRFVPAVTTDGRRVRSNVMMEIPVWAH